MGVVPLDFQSIQTAPSFEEAKRLLEVLKDKVKAGFKKLAFELHPDRTGNDPVKTAKFKLAANVKNDIEKLTVGQQPRPMPVPFVQPIQVVVVTQYYSASGTVTTATGGSPFRTQNAWAAAAMHPNGVGGRRGR
jgi:hypothetical protein